MRNMMLDSIACAGLGRAALRRVALASAATATLGLAACATPPATPAMPASGDLQCVAEGGAWAVGQAASTETVAKLQSDTHSSSTRVLRPGQPTTMDYRHDRVNVMLDEHDRIERVTCG